MLPFPIISKTNILPPVVSLQRMNTTENNIGLLYSNNEMYLKGTNAASELGNSGTTTNYATWNLARNDVSDFWMGGTSVVCKTITNQILICGSRTIIGSTGGAGLGFSDITSLFNAAGILVSDISDIQIGVSTMLVLTTSGNLYSIGSNTYGEGLGTGAKTSLQLIRSSVSKISLTAYTTVCIDSTGFVYGIGRNDSSQLLGTNTSNVTSWKTLYNSGTVKDVRARFRNTVLLLSTGVMLKSGYNANAEFGNGSTSGDPVSSYNNDSYKSVNSNITTFNTLKLAEGSMSTSVIYGLMTVIDSTGLLLSSSRDWQRTGAIGSGIVGGNVYFNPCIGELITQTGYDYTKIKKISHVGFNATFVQYDNVVYAAGLSTMINRTENSYSFVRIATPYN